MAIAIAAIIIALSLGLIAFGAFYRRPMAESLRAALIAIGILAIVVLSLVLLL
jgi:hypothetical protein